MVISALETPPPRGSGRLDCPPRDPRPLITLTEERMSSARATRAEYAVLWDVDGVIIDSAEQHRAAWEALARQEGLPYSDAAFWPTFGMRNADVVPRLYGVAQPAERVAALGERKE